MRHVTTVLECKFGNSSAAPFIEPVRRLLLAASATDRLDPPASSYVKHVVNRVPSLCRQGENKVGNFPFVLVELCAVASARAGWNWLDASSADPPFQDLTVFIDSFLQHAVASTAEQQRLLTIFNWVSSEAHRVDINFLSKAISWCGVVTCVVATDDVLAAMHGCDLKTFKVRRSFGTAALSLLWRQSLGVHRP
jgi:hypothetical protein